MSDISKNHIEDMGRLMAAMNAASGESLQAGGDQPDAKKPTAMRNILEKFYVATGDLNAESVSAPVEEFKGSGGVMRDILRNFHAAADESEDAMPVSPMDARVSYPELERALVTEATPTGVRTGDWEIVAKDGRFYDVTHAITKMPIATDLRLYEAAFGLVKAFSSGKDITSFEVKSILQAEDEYARALTDAAQFSQRVKVSEGVNRSVAEDRLSQTKARAILAKKTISDINSRL